MPSKRPAKRFTIPKRRVPKPILALAAPASNVAQTTLERLKDGQINWKLTVPGNVLAGSRRRAVEQARLLIADCLELERVERAARDAGRIAQDRATLQRELQARGLPYPRRPKASASAENQDAQHEGQNSEHQPEVRDRHERA